MIYLFYLASKWYILTFSTHLFYRLETTADYLQLRRIFWTEINLRPGLMRTFDLLSDHTDKCCKNVSRHQDCPVSSWKSTHNIKSILNRLCAVHKDREVQDIYDWLAVCHILVIFAVVNGLFVQTAWTENMSGKVVFVHLCAIFPEQSGFCWNLIFWLVLWLSS